MNKLEKIMSLANAEHEANQNAINDEDNTEAVNEAAMLTLSLILRGLCVLEASAEFKLLSETEQEGVPVLIQVYQDLLNDINGGEA